MDISGRTVVHASVMIACASSASLMPRSTDTSGLIRRVALSRLPGMSMLAVTSSEPIPMQRQGHGSLAWRVYLQHCGSDRRRAKAHAGSMPQATWYAPSVTTVAFTAEGVFSEVDYPGATLT